MSHDMLLGPAIGFAFTVGTIAFVAATAKGMEGKHQAALAADPDAFMHEGEEGPRPLAAPEPTRMADLAPASGQREASPPASEAAPTAPISQDSTATPTLPPAPEA